MKYDNSLTAIRITDEELFSEQHPEELYSDRDNINPDKVCLTAFVLQFSSGLVRLGYQETSTTY